MSHTWVNIFFNIQQTSGGFQLPLQACVQNKDVIRLQPRKVSHTKKSISFEAIQSTTQEK